jgi:hypothetical protein
MTVARPAGRPRLTRDQVVARMIAAGVDPAMHPLILVGLRAYYRDTMGAAGRNDRGIYDDAFALVGPGFYRTFNGNTDPSRYRKGKGTGAGKGMACLQPGFYRSHMFGLHKGYEALIQTGGEVTVWRDGERVFVDTGYFGINIHRGGYTTTGSEGCQTVPPDQWPEFIDAAQQLGKAVHGSAWRKAVVPYLLLEEPAK